MQITDLEEGFSNPAALRAMEFLQIIQALGLFLVPAFLYSWMADGKLFSFTKLNQSVSVIAVVVVLILMVSVQPMINFLVELNSRLSLPESLKNIEQWMKDSEAAATKLTEAFLKMNSITDFIIVFIMVAILPAIGEELLFRGILQRLFADWTKNIHWGIFISAFLFSAIHMQFLGFVPRMLLGVLLGYLFMWSGSIWLPIAAHFANNGLAVIFAFLKNKQLIQFDTDHIGTGEGEVWWTLSSAVLIGIIVYYFYKTRKTEVSHAQ